MCGDSEKRWKARVRHLTELRLGFHSIFAINSASLRTKNAKLSLLKVRLDGGKGVSYPSSMAR